MAPFFVPLREGKAAISVEQDGMDRSLPVKMSGLSRDDLYTHWHDYEATQESQVDRKAFAMAAWAKASALAGKSAPVPGFERWFFNWEESAKAPSQRLSLYDLGAFAWHAAWDLAAGKEASQNIGLIVEAKTKLADRPVVWKEAYTKRALFLKRQFHEVLGPGSYFRWEGHDTDTDDDYFVVVGPAKVHSPKAAYFAGVRKLPADYAAGGYYFHDMKEAMEYAAQTWGVPHPKGIRYYDSDDLDGISEKVKKWKDEIDEDERGEDFLREWLKGIQGGEGAEMSDEKQVEPVAYYYQASSTYPYFVKVAMPQWLKNKTGFQWWDVEDLLAGTDAGFNQLAATEPSLAAALKFAEGEVQKRKKGIAERYGSEYMDSDFYKVWLVYSGDQGTYLISVGPYMPMPGCSSFEDAFEKFGVFKWKLNLASQEDIDKKVNELIREYAENFHVQLTREDINVPVDKRPMVGEITINTSGREKIYGSPEWKTKILDFYNVPPGRGSTSMLKERYRQQNLEWNQQLQAAYAESQENGDAFRQRQPPPPRVDLMKQPYGQQISSPIYRQRKDDADKGKEGTVEFKQKYGFDSLQDAVNHLNATVMQGAPITNVANVTTADLAAARAKHKAEVATSPTPEVKQRKSPAPVTKPQQGEKPVDAVPTEKAPPKAVPVAPAVPAERAHDFDISESLDRLEDLASTSLSRMIKMAEDLDSKGKHAEAEEIHRILRKHITVK